MHIDHLIKQKSYEKTVYLLRRHSIVFLKDILLFIVLAIVPYGFYLLAVNVYPDLLSRPIIYPVLVLSASIYYLSIWLFLFGNFLDYYLDLWIVTNERIMNIEQHGLFGRTVSELDLWKIQDVTSDVKGVIPTFFNYGDVFIQTAGEKERFIFEQVHRPDEIRKRITELIEADRQYHLKDIQAKQAGI